MPSFSGQKTSVSRSLVDSRQFFRTRAINRRPKFCARKKGPPLGETRSRNWVGREFTPLDFGGAGKLVGRQFLHKETALLGGTRTRKWMGG